MDIFLGKVRRLWRQCNESEIGSDRVYTSGHPAGYELCHTVVSDREGSL